MKTNEHEFIKILQQRADEQRKIIQSVPFPSVFKAISIWLGVHPWRILIPIAIVFSIFLHLLLGKLYDDLILKIFGGFGLIRLY